MRVGVSTHHPSPGKRPPTQGLKTRATIWKTPDIAFMAVVSCLIPGCAATRPDVPAEAARVTGIENAIVFREEAAALDAPQPADRALTPVRAVRMALARDPRIQSALAKVRVAEADANQARL